MMYLLSCVFTCVCACMFKACLVTLCSFFSPGFELGGEAAGDDDDASLSKQQKNSVRG